MIEKFIRTCFFFFLSIKLNVMPKTSCHMSLTGSSKSKEITTVSFPAGFGSLECNNMLLQAQMSVGQPKFSHPHV